MQPRPGSLTGADSEQIIDLSKSANDLQESTGTTEPDAIHRRLGSDDGGVQNLAKSVIDQMESSSPLRKLKENQVKILENQTEAQEPAQLSSIMNENSGSGNGLTDTSNLDCPPKQKPVRLKPAVKTKKKNSKQAKKPAKKKKISKKKYSAKDDDDFEIDPRLGGSKIKQTLSNKRKDKKAKPSGSSQEIKRNRTCDLRNPYIHIEGSWNLPNVVKIVNGSVKEDEVEGKGTAKLTKAAQYVDEEHRSKAAKVGFSSTLSDRYDTHNRDFTWVCVFCQHFTHVQCLGDLYGPYYINQVTPEKIWFSKKNPDNITMEESQEDLNRPLSPSKKLKKSPKKRTSVKEEPLDNDAVAESFVSEVGKSGEKVEVWFHESCLVWAPGVCLIPPRLVGLDEAVSDAQQAICEYCKKKGAHIFCRTRGCGLRTHFPCAAMNDWTLHEETFLALCPLHSSQAAIT